MAVMDGNGVLASPFDGLRGLCHAERGVLSSEKVRERPHRMEASFYASKGYVALDAMMHSGFTIETIGDVADVWWFGPFPRRYVSDPQYGLPFLSSSDMMEARLLNLHQHVMLNLCNKVL
jgi:hypothetical protein